MGEWALGGLAGSPSGWPGVWCSVQLIRKILEEASTPGVATYSQALSKKPFFLSEVVPRRFSL